MLRISKLTDYGTVVLADLVPTRDRVVSAADIASRTGISVPTVSKVLKKLARAGFVTSSRGATGGYRLAQDPASITAADIIDALEGPVSITECSSDESQCDFEDQCSTGHAWQRINMAIHDALKGVSLADLARNTVRPNVNHFRGAAITIERTN